MLVYYGLPLLSALLLVAATRLRPAPRTNLALLLVSVVASLFLGEVLLSYVDGRISATRATFWPTAHSQAIKRQIERIAAADGVRFDTRSRLEVITELRGRGSRAVPGMLLGPLLREEPDGSLRSVLTLDGAEFLPLGGVSRSVTVLCNETGEYVVYDSDERGFHNPEGIWSSQSLEIAALGDSYTHGYCVPSTANFVARLRDRHPRALNLGIASTGPLAQWAAFLEYVPPLRPGVVLWFFYEENDLRDLAEEARSPLLMRYADGGFSQGLPGLQDEIDAALTRLFDEAIARGLETDDGEAVRSPREALRTVLRPARLRHLRRRLGLLPPAGVASDVGEPLMDLFRAILRQADALIGSWGGALYFVYLPARDRFAAGHEFRKEEVLSAVRGAGLPVIDLEAAFRESGDPLRLFPFRRFGHYNEAGHRLVAETVLEALASDGSGGLSAQP